VSFQNSQNVETPLVEMHSITKRFPGVTALNGFSFSVKPGEIHALLGENGSGKSTLIKILSGVYFPDEGEVYFKGQRLTLKNPLDAQMVGVATIHQEINLIPNIDVASNIFLNWEPMKGNIFINFKEMYKRTREVLKDLGVDLDPKVKASLLSPVEKQLVEIAKAIAREMSVLVLDEPTAALPAHEVEILFNIIERLKQQGIGIIYVSHRLEEIERIADRVTVIRDGTLVATKNMSELTIDDIIRLVVGREVEQIQRSSKVDSNDEVLRVEGFSRDRAFYNINLQLKKGEILGIAGLVGCGRSELAAALGGATPAKKGRAFLEGREIKISSPVEALKYGIGFLPSERKSEGLATVLPVRDNIIMASLKNLSRGTGIISDREISKIVDEFVSKLKIKISSVYQSTASLSGGNQQKLVLAKVLASGSKVLVFDEPTRGIDVGTRREIYGLLDELASAGNSVILSSSDLPELLQTCDRIMVLYKGKMTAEFRRGASQEEVLRAVLGQTEISGESSKEKATSEREVLLDATGGESGKRAAKSSEKKKFSILDLATQTIGVPLFIMVLVMLFAWDNPRFLSWINISNLSMQVSILLILSIAQAFAVITRGIDMSVGSTMAIVSMTMGLVGLATGNLPLGILVGLLVAILAGVVNMGVIGGLRADPFIMTLGVMYIGRGVALMSNDGQPVVGFPSWFSYIADGKIGPVPFMVVLVLMITVICQVVFTRTRFGQHLKAIGGNIDGAMVSGVKVGRCMGYGYIVSAFLAGIGSIIVTARFFSSQPNMGSSVVLETITAVIIGGMSLEGGRGDVIAVLIGVLMIGILSNGMNISNVPAYTQLVIMGAVLILSLIVDRMRHDDGE
jgi:ABC-type sugar transport system ATPase subunit/ribose/xylose/arabinose/galactoside ABC-type transport system permease subunit